LPSSGTSNVHRYQFSNYNVSSRLTRNCNSAVEWTSGRSLDEKHTQAQVDHYSPDKQTPTVEFRLAQLLKNPKIKVTIIKFIDQLNLVAGTVYMLSSKLSEVRN